MINNMITSKNEIDKLKNRINERTKKQRNKLFVLKISSLY